VHGEVHKPTRNFLVDPSFKHHDNSSYPPLSCAHPHAGAQLHKPRTVHLHPRPAHSHQQSLQQNKPTPTLGAGLIYTPCTSGTSMHLGPYVQPNAPSATMRALAYTLLLQPGIASYGLLECLPRPSASFPAPTCTRVMSAWRAACSTPRCASARDTPSWSAMPRRGVHSSCRSPARPWIIFTATPGTWPTPGARWANLLSHSSKMQVMRTAVPWWIAWCVGGWAAAASAPAGWPHSGQRCLCALRQGRKESGLSAMEAAHCAGQRMPRGLGRAHDAPSCLHACTRGKLALAPLLTCSARVVATKSEPSGPMRGAQSCGRVRQTHTEEWRMSKMDL